MSNTAETAGSVPTEPSRPVPPAAVPVGPSPDVTLPGESYWARPVHAQTPSAVPAVTPAGPVPPPPTVPRPPAAPVPVPPVHPVPAPPVVARSAERAPAVPAPAASPAAPLPSAPLPPLPPVPPPPPSAAGPADFPEFQSAPASAYDAHPGAPAYAAIPPAPSRPRPTALVVALVVLLVAALGLGGWLALGPRLGAGGQRTSTPTTQPSTLPTPAPSTIPGTVPPSQITPTDPPPAPPNPMAGAVPFDLTVGIASDWQLITVVGVWGVGDWNSVAVIRFASATNGVSLRGYDIHTGARLWTLDRLPGGAAFNVGGEPDMYGDAGTARASDGKLALALDAMPDPMALCPAVSYLAVISLETGDVSAVQSFDTGCGTYDNGRPDYSLVRLAAYQDGIVVAYQWRSPSEPQEVSTGSFVATTAYADTDLATPLWRVDGKYDLGTYAAMIWRDTDRVLWDQLVLTSSGTYADLRDGTESAFSINAGAGAPSGRAFHMVGEVAIESTGSAQMPGWVGALSLWASPAAAAPTWTYTPAGGEWLAYTKCTSPDLLVTTGSGNQQLAVSLRDGSLLWAITSTIEDLEWYANASCLIDTTGDVPVVLFSGDDGQIRTHDAFTGKGPSYIEFRGAAPVTGWTYGIHPCTYGLTCVVYADWPTNTVSLVAVDYTQQSPPVVAWTVSLGLMMSTNGPPAVYDVTGGIVAIGHRDDGTYVFLNLAGK